MKKLLLLTVLLCGSAFANSSIDLKRGDYALSKITDAEVLSVNITMKKNCPINALCAPVSLVKVKLGLKGCLDRLGTTSAKAVYNSFKNNYDLMISAVNIHNEDSKKVRCKKQKTEIIEVRAAAILSLEDINIVLF